jgi:hypothetical protein
MLLPKGSGGRDACLLQNRGVRSVTADGSITLWIKDFKAGVHGESCADSNKVWQEIRGQLLAYRFWHMCGQSRTCLLPNINVSRQTSLVHPAREMH